MNLQRWWRSLGLNRLPRSNSSSGGLGLCASCVRTLGQAYRIQEQQQSRRGHGHNPIARPGTQASPLTGYYAAILDHVKAPCLPSKLLLESPPKPTDSQETELQTRAKIVFGPPLIGPAARKANQDAQAQYIAGVRVPTKPSEPDNCCMSGCVNCVWDLYREDVEYWAAQMDAAKYASRTQHPSSPADDKIAHGSQEADVDFDIVKSIKNDDDGATSGTTGKLDSLRDETMALDKHLFNGIPLGIREFMKTEKMLKMKHAHKVQP